jgi:hypothetical protein
MWIDKIYLALNSSIFWGVVTFILAAIAFSGRFSVTTSNGFLFAAFLVGCFGIFRSGWVIHLNIICCLSLGIVLTLISWWIQPLESPDVTLRFVYPTAPALILTNQSAIIAKNIKWTVVLWNMDLPDRNDPLPIPVGTFDWIKPHDEGGPLALFNSPPVSSLLKQGNRLFGCASVDCPNCDRGRTYIVYITWGEGGWFSELKNEKSGRIIVPPDFSKASRIEYFKALEAAVPRKMRVPIGDK